MARLLLRPGWIVTHLAVLGIAVVCISLGLWQLDRHAEVAAENERTAAAIAARPAPLDDVLGADDVEHRPVVVEGRYDDAQVRLSPRSDGDRPGFEVLTPLVLEDGRRVVVDRGWMPLDSPLPAPPAGTVRVEGRLRTPGEARQVLPVEGGPAELVSAVDLDVLAGQVDQLVTTAWVERVDADARAEGTLPRPAGPVSLDGGNHLSYAVQWFAFAAIGLIGYPLLLRRRLVEARDEPAVDPDDPARPTRPDDTGRHVEASRVSQ